MRKNNKMKVVKLTTKELTERIKKIISEQEEVEQEPENETGKAIALGVDENGNHYVIDMEDPENPKLIAKTK